jgi:hypothetical protein
MAQIGNDVLKPSPKHPRRPPQGYT